LKKGDVLLTANGQAINSRSKLQEVVEGSPGKPVNVRIDREGKQESFDIQPVISNPDGRSRWMIGVLLDQKLNIITEKLSFSDALTESVRQNMKGATLIVQFLKGILERRMSAKGLVGPVGLAQASGQAAHEGPSAFVSLMSMVSLNLAIVNLLPIPILDGGVILLLLVEMVIRRDLSMPVKEAVIKVGFVFLMVVTVFALYNDISKILPAG
jgi:regulator of sigma E protease